MSYQRWAGTEPQEAPDPDLDDLTRAELAEFPPPAADVADVLDEWRRTVDPSVHGVGLFLDLLAARGYRVEPIGALGFNVVLPAPVE